MKLAALRVPRRRTKLMGLLGPALECPLPVRIEGVEQYAGMQVPAACPHCKAPEPTWVIQDERSYCISCGQDFYRTAYRYVMPPPRRYNVPTNLQRLKKGA